jgi:hypothetical protein
MDKTTETERFDWAICEADDSVANRFATKEEAERYLASGACPEGCTVQYVEDPGEL